MIKLRKNRKGALITAVPDFLSFFFLAIVLLVFYFLFNVAGERAENQINADMAGVTYATELVNYLKTPIGVDLDGDGTDEEITFADLIAYSKIDKGLRKKELKDPTKVLFDYLYEKGWSVKIIYSSGDEFKIGHSHSGQKRITYIKSFIKQGGTLMYLPLDISYKKIIYVPGFDTEPIEIELHVWYLYA